MLLFGRNQHNSVNQLSFHLKKKKLRLRENRTRGKKITKLRIKLTH